MQVTAKHRRCFVFMNYFDCLTSVEGWYWQCCFSLISWSEQLLFVSAARPCMTTVFFQIACMQSSSLEHACECAVVFDLTAICVFLWVTSWGGLPAAWQKFFYYSVTSLSSHNIVCTYSIVENLKLLKDLRPKCSRCPSYTSRWNVSSSMCTTSFAIVLFSGLHFSIFFLVASDDDPAGPV